MNPFNNNTQNLSSSELTQKKALDAVSRDSFKCKNNSQSQEDTKLLMGSLSIKNVYNKPQVVKMKFWNSTYKNASNNIFNTESANLNRDHIKYFIDILPNSS